MSLLFSPLTLRETTFRNRLWVAAMCMYSTPDGIPGRWHARHLSQFAVGGAGLVMTEATAVSPEGRISPRDAGIWSDAHRDAWAEIAADVHEAGALAGMQLAHAGRKASTWWPFSGRSGYVPPEEGGWSTVGPSDRRRSATPTTPRRRRSTRQASRPSSRTTWRPPAARSTPASTSSRSTPRTVTSSTSSSRR